MIRTALVQMNVSENVDENLKHAAELIKIAADNEAVFAVLPEMFCCPYENTSFMKNKEPAGGRIWQALSKMASDNSIYLIGGSMPEEDGDKLFNTCFVFDKKGNQIARHRKVHLFDVDIIGGQHFLESLTFSAGDEVTVAETEYGKIGVEVCFDIRFEELTRLMALKGAELVFVPANFNMTSGPLHWELLFRARAVDNQLYVFGCSAARNESASYVSYGNTIAVSPWAEVLGRLGAEEGILYAEADPEYIRSIREQLPVMNARRSDVYELREN